MIDRREAFPKHQYWFDVPDTTATLQADKAVLREGLVVLLEKSDAVRVLAAEQAAKLPSRTLWNDDLNQFVAAQEIARALLEKSK